MRNYWLTVDAGKTLLLNGTTITGMNSITGTFVDNRGTIRVTGDSTIDAVTVANNQATIDSNVTLTLDDALIANGTVSNSGTIKVDALKTLYLQNATLTGGTIANAGAVVITIDSTIENAIFNNTQLKVTGFETLTLSGTTVTGGTSTITATSSEARSTSPATVRSTARRSTGARSRSRLAAR